MKKWTLHQTKKTVTSALISLLFILSLSGSVYGAQLTLAWNKPDDARVTGYNIYCGISGTNFTSTPVQTVNSADQTTCLISGIEDGKTYSLAATSTDASGKESAFSETITYTLISPNDIDDDRDGYTENQGDCNDANAAIHPGAVEICGDGIDQDCNGSDQLCPEDIDDDRDGYTENQGDCNDTNSKVHPGAVEICGDGIDQDCSGSDQLCPEDIDDDRDGYTENQGDCNDANASIHPGAVEICGDGIDQDCNGSDQLCPEDIDDDHDGYTENQGDCNDANASIYPGAVEICGDGIDQNCDEDDLECTPPAEFVMETGEIEIDHQWTFVELKKTFVNPIVVANPLGSNDPAPAVVRVRNVTAEGFEMRVQEWDYQDGIHGLESVSYIVMEAGNHTLPDGTMVEAGNFQTNDSASVAFSGLFIQMPVVVAGVSSFNDSDAVAGRIYRVVENGFDFSLQEQELNKDGHAMETISYIAWEPSVGKVDGLAYEAASTSATVKQIFNYLPCSQFFTEAPVCVASMQTANGMDSASVRWQNKDAYGIEFKVEEETSFDSEVYHAGEAIGFIMIDKTPELSLETGEVEINDQWTFVPFTLSFDDPVVVAKPISSYDAEPAVVRVRKVTPEGFEIRVQEWDYQDGKHALETVSYMVMEAGSHKLANGTMVEAGTFDTNGPQSILLSLDEVFSKAPVVLAGVVTDNEADAVTGRIYNVTAKGFNFNLQEQESSNQAHASETIAYIAWEPSSGEVNGRTYEVATTPSVIKQSFYGIFFSSSFSTAPVFVADMQTRNGIDTANVRWQNKDLQGVEVRIAEEVSRDAETFHGAEAVGYLAIE
ncbi:MAG: hypothetical protein C4518_06890 [Desulfobacteraceae bacterium]|nr:MAG: hypothetical protein C4518_06890 [Desulfobacteraceae bacterium]